MYLDREREELVYGSDIRVLQAYAWKIKFSPKLKKFIWQFILGCLLVKKKLNATWIKCDTQCARCSANEETINHVFSECLPAI